MKANNMERQLVLDDKSFKALSADSRVSILKSLGERRRTLSELSQKLNLGNSTVKEHCEILINAELIKQMDEGRKWKYYELTQKGKQIVMPNILDEVKVLIILCFGVIMVGAITFFALQMFSGVGANYSSAPEMQLNTIMGQGAPTQLTKTITGMDQNLTSDASTAKGINSNDNNYQYETPPAQEPFTQAQCTTTAQCSIRESNGITTEFFILSSMISVMFGIVLGWAIVRRR
ncbi:MAG: winged helix-turn-helix domain-containing protein [archaeon]